MTIPKEESIKELEELRNEWSRHIYSEGIRKRASLDTAIKALEQEPEMVRYEGDGYADGRMVYDVAYCPNCDHEFEEDSENWRCNFCPNCGQMLKWEVGITREEAIERLNELDNIYNQLSYEDKEAIDEAIKALEQEPTTKIEESNFSQEQYLAHIQSAYDCGESIIDKIRAEIDGLDRHYDNDYFSGNKDSMFKCDEVLQIIDKYKAKSEE